MNQHVSRGDAEFAERIQSSDLRALRGSACEKIRLGGQDIRELIVSTRLQADKNGSQYERYPIIQTLHLRGVSLKCSVSSC